MSDLNPRDLIKNETRKRNTKNFWLRSAVQARNELTQGPRDLRPPKSRGVVYYSPKYEPPTTGSARPMGRADYASGTTLNERGQVTSQVPRVSKGVQRAGALDLFPKLKGVVDQASRPLKVANPIWRAASTLDNLMNFLPSPDQDGGYPNSDRYPAEGGYWEKRYGDFGPYTDYNPLNGLWMHTNTYHTVLSGQALSGTVLANGNFTAPADGTYGLYWTRYSPVRRYAHHSSYFKKTDAFDTTITSHKWSSETSFRPGVFTPNANATRSTPGFRQSDPIAREKAFVLATDRVADFHPESIWKAVAVSVPLRDPLSEPDTKERTKPQPLVSPAPLQPAGKSPPQKNEHQGKASGGRGLAQHFARALDFVSESAEVVDAVYDALPDDVKKRWEKGRESRGLADQAGQYGIDGADWKAKAIWENRDKIDYSEAIKNIVQNQVEDQLYGAAYSARDDIQGRGRNRGNPKRQFDKKRKYNHKRSSEKRARKWSK